MVVHRAFDEVFRSWSHVAVLRTLIDTTTGRTGNEIARMSGMQPRSALKALTTLEDLGIVRRQRGGRDHIFTLNSEHYLVREAVILLYKAERQFEEQAFRTLADLLEGKVESAVIFGSTARRQENPLSDLDICCIVRKEKDREELRSFLNGESGRLHEEFGMKLAPLVITVAEAKSKKDGALLKRIAKEGKAITGKALEEVLGR